MAAKRDAPNTWGLPGSTASPTPRAVAASVAERTPRVSPRHLRGNLFVPDSLPYDRGRLADAKLSLTAVLAATGETGAVLNVTATFTDDPSGSPTWIQLAVQGHIGWPAGVGYRVVALTPLDAVR
jgi:hypothetical protein